MLRAVRKTKTGPARLQKRRKNPKPTVNAKTNAADTRELQIPDSVIDQILQIMKVPETSWSDVGYEVYSAVQSCVESFADGRLGVNKSGYRSIASDCNRLRRKISGLNARERRHFGDHLPGFEKNLEEIEGIAASLALHRRPRHRPHGSVKYPHIRDLVYDLYVIGGELTLSKDVAGAKTKGSLQAVLEILRDHLSSEIFPADISFNTLKEMRHWAEGCLEDKAQQYLSHLDEDDPLFHEDDRSA